MRRIRVGRRAINLLPKNETLVEADVENKDNRDNNWDDWDNS